MFSKNIYIGLLKKKVIELSNKNTYIMFKAFILWISSGMEIEMMVLDTVQTCELLLEN